MEKSEYILPCSQTALANVGPIFLTSCFASLLRGTEAKFFRDFFDSLNGGKSEIAELKGLIFGRRRELNNGNAGSALNTPLTECLVSLRDKEVNVDSDLPHPPNLDDHRVALEVGRVRQLWQRRIDEYKEKFYQLTREDFENGFIDRLDSGPMDVLETGGQSRDQVSLDLSRGTPSVTPNVAAFVRNHLASRNATKKTEQWSTNRRSKLACPIRSYRTF